MTAGPGEESGGDSVYDFHGETGKFPSVGCG